MTKLNDSKMIVVLLALLPAASLADDYRVEVKGTFDRDMPDGDGPLGDPDTTTLSGTWYFAPVATDGVPLAEASFLGRASSLSAIAARFEVFGTHLNAQAANVSYYIPGTMFYAGAGVSHQQDVTAVNSTTVLKEYNSTWFGTVGVAPLDGLLVTTNFQEGGYDPNVTARYVGKLPNAHFYAGSVGVVDPDQGDRSFRLDFDYYLDESASLGIGYADGDDRLELRAEKFFSRSWAAGVSAYTADSSKGFGVHVTWRN
ncbi:MAG: hypothetical protein ABI769_17675 [Pseudomonadota bacterium]